MSTIGDRIREAREAKGWTQGKLAEELDIAQAFVSQIENGRRRPTPALVKRITESLGIDRASLMVEQAQATEKVALIHRKLEGLSATSLEKIEDYVRLIRESEKGR